MARSSDEKTNELLNSQSLQIVGSLPREFSITRTNSVLPVSGFIFTGM